MRGSDSYRGRETVEKTFYFNYASRAGDVNDIVTAIRNISLAVDAKIYPVMSSEGTRRAGHS